MANAPPGTQTTALRQAARVLFSHVRRGRLDQGIITDGLCAAAQHADAPEGETWRIIAEAAGAEGLVARLADVDPARRPYVAEMVAPGTAFDTFDRHLQWKPGSHRQ